MDIKNILDSLGLDLSNPEVKRGALEAIEAIMDSRTPSGGGGGPAGSGGTEEIEIDPDLLQPSLKQPPSFDDTDDIEIEDEEHILDQIQRNDSEDQEPSEIPEKDKSDSESSDTEKTDSSDNDNTGSENDDSEAEDEENSEESENIQAKSDNSSENIEDDNAEDSEEAGIDSEDGAAEGETDEVKDSEDEFNEDDMLDDETKNIFTDADIKSKHEARKIKRERTLQAAKKALADAQAKKVSPALIHELEKAITALEELTEAVKKTLANLSDEEFNLIINRVFDAIDAVGDKSLSFTSEEERDVRAKEIKNDLADTRTQAELSAEDVAKIRAENQAIKARDRESDKYKARSRASFKGFQDFLNSLYRAIALQVHTDEEQNDTWSALNRRHSGSSVLQPGRRIQELPNKKIPVIDFYFDCSGSWDENDIAIGQKAVSRLADMEADGQIKINIYYFSNDVFTDAGSARAQGGTAAWNEIVKNVISTQATNVIIMTDNDMETWWRGSRALTYTVPGYVWYLWRDGENAPRLPRDLKGRGGTQQFSFSRGDL
jgi:hypothetical protein